MKKLGAILLFSILILNILSFAVAEVQAQEAPELPGGVEKIVEATEKISDEDARSEYLKQEWKKILENSVFGKALLGIDSFLTKISIVFQVLFGEPYSRSLILLSVIILWGLIAVKVAEIIRGWGIVQGNVSYIIGIACSVILAQLQLLKRPVVFVFNFISSLASWWYKAGLIAIIIIAIVLVYYFLTDLSKFLKEKRKKQKEEKAETTQKEMKKVTKGLEKGAGI